MSTSRSRTASPTGREVDVLVISVPPLWPADRGYRVHGARVAAALRRLGYRVGIACMEPGDDPPPAELAAMLHPWPEAGADALMQLQRGWAGPLAPLRRKLASYRGVEPARLAGLVPLVERLAPRVVLGTGQLGGVLLQALRRLREQDMAKLWYAADEVAYFHLSCMTREGPADWAGRLQHAAIHAALERGFGSGLDGVIGVHPRDTALLRLATGARAETIRNGVDLDYFAPDPDAAVEPQTLIFWGRLDFEPNVDAARWLANDLVPALRKPFPGATLRLVGRQPCDAVLALGDRPGVEVVGPVDDLRPMARSTAAVVLPMRCGGGIKNKLLEAAGMGLPIVASSKAVGGLSWDDGETPLAVADGLEATRDAVGRAWRDAAWAASLRASARRWVERRHTWEASARGVIALAEAVRGGAIEPTHAGSRHAPSPAAPAATA